MSFALTLAFAATAATVPAAVSASSIQADFDAASAAVEAKDCARAVPLFEALRQNPKVRPGSVAAGAIAVRLGGCLMGTARGVEGEIAILDGVPILERAGATFAGDLDNAYTLLGDAAYGRLDYVGARGWSEKALALHAGADRMATLARLAKATAFDGGPEPLAYADEGLRLAGAQEKPSKQLLATFHTLHARILLNRGQTEQAYAELKQSLSLTGGLKNRISLSDAVMRGDLALAAILAGRKEDARLYLANTGAGRIA